MVEEPPAGRPAAASVSSMVRLQPHRPSGRGRGSHRPQQETAAPSPSCSARRGFTSLRQLAREPSPACMKASIRTLRRMIRASWLSRCPLRFPPATCTSDRGSRHAPAAHYLLRHDASTATHRYPRSITHRRAQVLKKNMLKRRSDCLRFIKEAKIMTKISHE